jgi:hypothetical protein
MKKIVFAALALTMGLSAAAQDTYESARLLGGDLNGTARYVGMGGAMEALGADISTIGTNPAGIGLFRHSQANVSFGFVSQQDAQKFDNLGKTNMSFDQAGFVYSNIIPDFVSDDGMSINFGFNYHKSRNFDQILNVADHELLNASLNGLTHYKYMNNSYRLDYDKNNGFVGRASDGYRAYTYSQFDDLNVNGLYMGGIDDLGTYMDYNDAEMYNFDRAHRGWISDFDFNLSGNYQDWFYWGITVGLKDVNYKGYGEYAERLNRLDDNNQVMDAGVAAYGDERRIKGTGYEVKAGVIVRPIQESPFRVGVSVASPTFYRLSTENYTNLYNNTVYAENADGDWFSVAEKYDFKYYTPWKFGVSVGHTVGKKLALGLSYEYSDYGAARNRVNDGYDSYGDEESYTDEPMKRHAEQVLNGVSTLKVGAELKPVPALAIRLGYNYVSAAYDEQGSRDMTISSPGVMYASTADYVNWKDTNRFTCGLGVKAGKMNIDLAYQYNVTNGVFHPFQQYEKNSIVSTADVSNKRHQLLLTIGYTF